jgi:hypothetical protein
MARRIVLEGLEPQVMLVEELAENEHHLQEKLKEHADLLPVDEFGWSGPLMVVGRETRLPSGAVDLIGVTPSGEILVAEFKTRPQNTDFRGAVAQALDYGADLWRMTPEQFDTSVVDPYFNGRYCPEGDPRRGMRTLLEAADVTWHTTWDDEDREAFPARVRVALERGHVHYAVVAQRFTPAMERTIEYLNEISTGPTFYLVELIRFASGTYVAYEARTVVKPKARRGEASQTLDMERFLELEPVPAHQRLLRELLEFARSQQLAIEFGTGGLSIRAHGPDRAEPISIGWLFPSTTRLGFQGLRGVALGFPRQHADPATKRFAPALAAYRDRLAIIPGAVPATAAKLDAVTFTHGEAARADQEIKDALAQISEAASALA